MTTRTPTTRTPTEIFEAVLDAWSNLRRRGLTAAGLAEHFAHCEAVRDEFDRSLGNSTASREMCSECGRISAVGFYVPNTIWAAALPADRCNDIFCVGCFARFADRAYVQWDLDIQFFPVSKRTHRESLGYAQSEPTASAEEAFNGPVGTGSGTVVVGWGPPGEESPIPPGGIVPGAYRVESVAAGEGPDGPTLNMEIAPLADDSYGLLEALKASLAASRPKKEN